MSMEPSPPPSPVKPPQLVWWVIWFGILNSLMLVSFLMGRKSGAPVPAGSPSAVGEFAGLVPLAVSVILRWAVVPRLERAQAALAVFILGLSLAEACGFMGTFLGRVHTKDMVTLGMLGILQWAPLFAARFYPAAPAGSGLRQP